MNDVSDLAFFAAFIAGGVFTSFLFWGWNRDLRRDRDYWLQRYRASDQVLTALALANASSEIAPENVDDL